MTTFVQDYRKTLRLQLAQQYAAEARIRNTPPCSCAKCVLDEKLPAVLNIIEAQRGRHV